MRVGVVRSRMRIEATEERPPCQSDFDLVRRNLARLVSCVGTAGIGTAAANARFLQGLGASIPRNVSNFAQFYLWDGLVLASSKGGAYVCCANSTPHIGTCGNVTSKEMMYTDYKGAPMLKLSLCAAALLAVLTTSQNAFAQPVPSAGGLAGGQIQQIPPTPLLQKSID